MTEINQKEFVCVGKPHFFRLHELWQWKEIPYCHFKYVLQSTGRNNVTLFLSSQNLVF